MKLDHNIHTFLGCDASFEDAQIVLFGAPFDGTTSFRPGTRFASSAMRNESYGIETYSPYQDKDLSDYRVFDAGDLELPFGDPASVLNQVEHMVASIVEEDKFPLMIGGEHLLSLAPIRRFAQLYPDLHVIQFDAHTDLREEYLGQKLSHASVMKRAWDLLGDSRIYQFGIRSGEREEFLWANKHTHLQKFNFEGLENVVKELQDKPVYFTLDLDVLDPSVFPGTGTPEAGGVSFEELMRALRLISRLNIVGADLNELSPPYDLSGNSTSVANKILRELMLFILK